MAAPRIVDPNGLYHVFSRGNFKQPIFLDDDHYRRFVAATTKVAERYGWLVLDWCLLTNHYHLFIRLQDDGLSAGMRELNGGFSRWSNRQTGRTWSGHLVKNRFGSVDVIREGHLLELVTYIPLNPVRAGLVEEPQDWPWSGFRATVGLEHPFPFHRPSDLLRLLGSTRAGALRRYDLLVREAHARDGQASWSDQVA
jgi:REP element-mobilizing transposase RayT